MMGTKLVIMGLGFVLLVGMLSPMAMGENDSLYVILTAEDRNYSVGDKVNLEMQIYDQGMLKNVASIGDIRLDVSINNNFANPVSISMTAQSTGVYTAAYTVRAADSNQVLYFFYDVTIGNDHEKTVGPIDALVIPVRSIQDTVDVSFNGQDFIPARPGDNVTATIITKTGTTLNDFNGFSDLYVQTPNGLKQDLTPITIEDGIYTAVFTVPQVSVSGTYVLLARPNGINSQDTACIYVNVLDVWCHKTAVSGTTVSVEVCVADLLGVPLEGANFMIQRGVTPYDRFFGTTDDSGKALLDIDGVEGTVDFTGYVLAAGLNQTIDGSVTNPVAAAPDMNGFDILYQGTQTIFEPGSETTLSYKAYDARAPAVSREISYYVTAAGTSFDNFFGHLDEAREVVAAGKATTNFQGIFNITFDVPETQCVLRVSMEVPLGGNLTNVTHDIDDNRYYDTWPQNITEGFEFYAYEGKLDGDKEVGIGGGSFRPGKAGTVSVELSAATGDPVIAKWYIGEYSLEISEAASPEWSRWVPAGNMLQLSQTESGKYEATFMVPEFIDGQDVTIISGYMDPETGVPHFDSKQISPGGGLPWLWIIMIIIIIVVVLVLVIVLKEKYF